MQSRSYEPDASNSSTSLESFKKDRRCVGDWLIGVLHHFPTGDFTLKDAQGVYESLLDDLNHMKGNAATAAMAKAYCPIGGAAVYEFFPFYGDDMHVMDGIFFLGVLICGSNACLCLLPCSGKDLLLWRHVFSFEQIVYGPGHQEEMH